MERIKKDKVKKEKYSSFYLFPAYFIFFYVFNTKYYQFSSCLYYEMSAIKWKL